MFPVWFFIVLVFLICYLLYATRATNATLGVISKTKLRHLQTWFRMGGANQKNEAKR